MFELSVARKYLIPRVRQLSVSIISLISVFVIAIVVWLSIVFFSAQEGIERSWTEKMVALTSPIRLTPTDQYYKSYYYQIDAYSSASTFAYKGLREKLSSTNNDPYDIDVDPSLPRDFPEKTSVDIVKATIQAIKATPNTSCRIFDTAQCSLHIRFLTGASLEQEVTSTTYLMSFDDVSTRLTKNITTLPENGIILPKTFKDAGVKVNDEGYISYQGFGATASQELRSKVVVAGFYDPGILPVGGKVSLVSSSLISQVLSATFSEQNGLPTGISVDFDNLKDAHAIKDSIVAALTKDHLVEYWTIQSYDEYDFSKDIFQQMKADKNLFSLISVIITIVACSNIISMLLILVHDKRKEIAILRALGASKASIAGIFGLCGFLLGAVGSFIGAILAVLTLHNLAPILAFISKLQGFEVLSSTFYANSLPNAVSTSSLLFVICISAVASCLAGLIPAIQASRINTSEALRNE
ncbi:MAG: FtsX-like permease family protein [Chlamydiales bacterium]|nr:FtsX-like permease family protein [Chlamydiales bacterium]